MGINYNCKHARVEYVPEFLEYCTELPEPKCSTLCPFVELEPAQPQPDKIYRWTEYGSEFEQVYEVEEE